MIVRALAAVSAVMFLSAAVFGCSSGLSKEDADVRCDQDKASLGSLFGTKTYEECEACYMECGDSCKREDSSPITYACADDSGSGGSATTTD